MIVCVCVYLISQLCVCVVDQPALSIGNVGQLAVDLLIASTRAERVGYLDDPNVLPCVGNDAYWPSPQGQLALPLEGTSLFTHFLNSFLYVGWAINYRLYGHAYQLSGCIIG